MWCTPGFGFKKHHRVLCYTDCRWLEIGGSANTSIAWSVRHQKQLSSSHTVACPNQQTNSGSTVLLFSPPSVLVLIWPLWFDAKVSACSLSLTLDPYLRSDSQWPGLMWSCLYSTSWEMQYKLHKAPWKVVYPFLHVLSVLQQLPVTVIMSFKIHSQPFEKMSQVVWSPMKWRRTWNPLECVPWLFLQITIQELFAPQTNRCDSHHLLYLTCKQTLVQISQSESDHFPSTSNNFLSGPFKSVVSLFHGCVQLTKAWACQAGSFLVMCIVVFNGKRKSMLDKLLLALHSLLTNHLRQHVMWRCS